MKIPSIIKFLPVVFFLVFNIPVQAIAASMPTSPTVMSGSATMDSNGTTMKVDVTSSGLTQIDWNSFSIGAGDTVNFQQVNTSDIVLNRVTGTESSSIMGAITANGNVMILNSNGVLFGKTAQIDVGGILAVAGTDTLSSGATSMSSGDSFNLTGSMENDGSIITNNGGPVVLMGSTVLNKGNIGTLGGDVAMVGNSVSNEGTITANSGGTIDLVSGTSPTINLDSSGDISVQVSPTNCPNPPNSCTYGAFNTGTLQANGGNILLDAFINDGANPGYFAVNASGIIMANALLTGHGYEDGQIVLSSQGDNAFNVTGTSSGTGASLLLTPELSSSSVPPKALTPNPSPSPSPSPSPTISGAIITIDSADNISDSANITAVGYGAEVSINAPGTLSIENGSINVSEFPIGISGLSPAAEDININAGITDIFSSSLSVTNITGNDATISIENSGALNIQSSSLTTLSWGGTGDISVTGNSFLISNSSLSSGSSNGGNTASIEVTGTGNAIDWIFGSSLIATEVTGATASVTVTAPSDLMVDGSTISALNSYGGNASIYLGNFSTIYNSNLTAVSDKSIGQSIITLSPGSDLPNTNPASGIILPNGTVGLTFQYGIMFSKFITTGGAADILMGRVRATNITGNLIIQFSSFVADSYGIPIIPGPTSYIQIGIQFGGASEVLLQGDQILAHSYALSPNSWAEIFLDFYGAVVTTFPVVGWTPLTQMINDYDLMTFTESIVPNYLTTILAQSQGGYASVTVDAGAFYDLSGEVVGSGVGGNSTSVNANFWCADNACFPLLGPPSITPNTPSVLPGSIIKILSTPLTQPYLQPLTLEAKDPEDIVLK